MAPSSSTLQPNQSAARLALVVAITAFSLVGILVLGIVGFRTGFAAAVGVPTLSQTLGEAFARGLAIPVALLQSVYTTGVRTPLLFTGALIIMLPPIAAIVIATPRRTEQQPPRSEARIAAAIGGGLIVLADIIIAVRTAAASHNLLKAPFGENFAAFAPWIESMEALAATDLIALVVAVLLAVLVFRLPLDRWARAVVGTLTIGTCVIAAAATAASGGRVAGIDEPRSVIHANPGTSLLLGTTDTRLDVLVGWDVVDSTKLNGVVIQLPKRTLVLGPKSLRQFVASPSSE